MPRSTKCHHEFAVNNNSETVCILCNWNKTQSIKQRREHKISGLENTIDAKSLDVLNSIKF